ncbi:MAG: electron transfer flavoprotein subunit beta/FixA family protein [bacterium JZ-2024 1]
MRVAVLVKYVPDATDLEYDLNASRIIRENVLGTQNADDLAAVEVALQHKDRYGAEVDVVAMAPESAEEMIREYLAMGADRAILVTSPALRGSDGYVTARVLSAVIARNPYDLIIAGLMAADGQTSQTGPRIAQALGIPSVTYVDSPGEIKEGTLVISRRTGDHRVTFRVRLPAVITVQRHLVRARLASVQGILEAQMKEIQTLTESDLGLSPSDVGAEGSRVRIISAERVETKRQVRWLPETPDEAAEEIVKALVERGVLEQAVAK